ncbi:hypothetical protein BABA_00815 [Neobacillus bataviensis LMG 21833]|uniref:Zinc-finger domain-containing protein n=1 Tax=Neobacillus bataviensis LMG 21833 TaxID=1117379 RepID=K6EDL6_9BACI|nr:hypothetical protein [Neobacillus bataviensis]EKN71531.1 hypothetical protein BABA_00815 [Neobacillus bataviensis LMG 21833]
MKHYSYDEWMQYVKDEINDTDREQLENHLYTCDKCLENYLEAVSANETSLPALSNESSFTDQVMAMLVPSVVPDTINNTVDGKKPFYQQVVFHYFLAAVATILLMFSGAFQSLATYASSLESPQHVQEKKSSVTEGVINKTFAWMDSLEKKEADKK